MSQHDTPLAESPWDAVVDAVAAAYGFTIDAAPPIRLGGAVNRVLHVATSDGELVIRVHRAGMTPKRLMAVHRIQERLRVNGLPIPLILTTRDRASWIRVDGHLVEVLRFMAGGHEVASWADAAAVFTALGRFHGAVRAIDAHDLPPPVYSCYATPGEALSLLGSSQAAFRTQADDPDYPEAVAARAVTSNLLHQIRTVRRTWKHTLPHVLIHGDFVGYNVLLEEERVIAILDFDRLAVRERTHDVAYTLMYVLSRLVHDWKAASGNALQDRDIAAIAALLTVYNAASGWHMTPQEILALPFEMARAPLFPIVAADTDAVAETLRVAPHLPVARWLVDHAADLAAALH